MQYLSECACSWNNIDLILLITHKMKVFPGSPQPVFLQWSKHENQGYDSEVMFLSLRTGTHKVHPLTSVQSLKLLTKFQLIDLSVLIIRQYYYTIEKGENELIEYRRRPEILLKKIIKCQ